MPLASGQLHSSISLVCHWLRGWRTMLGPCLGHKRAIFWTFIGKGGYRIHPALWIHTSSILCHPALLFLAVPLASDQVHSSTSLVCHLLSTLLGALLSEKVENICQYWCQESEIWHGASLGTLIKIQEEPIWRTMWGPCFGHKRAIFWPFLGKGHHGIHPELWNLAWSIPGHIDYDSGRTNSKDHVSTMF